MYLLRGIIIKKFLLNLMTKLVMINAFTNLI